MTTRSQLNSESNTLPQVAEGFIFSKLIDRYSITCYNKTKEYVEANYTELDFDNRPKNGIPNQFRQRWENVPFFMENQLGISGASEACLSKYP